MPKPGRFAAFDVIRGIGTFIVLIRHCGPAPEATPAPLKWLLDRLQLSGWVALESFFVLSGFLVSGLLFSEYRRRGQIRFWHFIARRGAKIYPSFYLLVLLTLLFGTSAGLTVDRPRALAEILFFQNYRWGLWVHTWSLALEEHFYLLLPLVLVLLGRRARASGGDTPADPFRALVPLYAFIAFATLAARIITLRTTTPVAFITHFTPTHLRIDSLAAGMLLGYFFHFRRDRLFSFIRAHRRVVFAAMIVGLAPSLFFSHLSPITLTVGLPMVAWGVVAMLALLLTQSESRVVPARPSPVAASLAFIGRHSFGIYLWHQPVRWWGGAAIRAITGREPSYAEYALLLVLGGITVGILISRLVEFPVLKLRDRLVPSRAGSLVSND